MLSASSGLSVLALFRWLEHTAVGTAIRQSQWGFAVIEIVHLLGLALLGGATLVIGLRLLGVVLTGQPVASVVRGLLPTAVAGLTILLISGVLLLSDGPLRYYANSAFRVKMAALPLAVLVSALALRAARRTPDSAGASAALRLGAVVALFLWLSVAVAGRAIGVL